MKFEYTELNEKSFEELKEIREKVLDEILEKENLRQGLIRNIIFLQNFSDLFSIRKGLFNDSNASWGGEKKTA